jgi:hypothetical protein
MSFIRAMNSMNMFSALQETEDIKIGVNGEIVYTEEGVGDYRLTLYTMLNRDLEKSYIHNYVEKIFKEGDHEKIIDLFVMAFQTRDVRGGKGEKRLFHHFVSVLYKNSPNLVESLIPLIPEYGCWRDMWEILKVVPELEKPIFEYTKQVFETDMKKEMNLSLLGKWLPRENSKTYPGLGKKLSTYLFPYKSEKKCLTHYRKAVSDLNRKLETTEIKMCNGTWRYIYPERVPGRSLKIHNQAFLNIKKNKETRYPENKDRIECRENFLSFIESIKKGEKTAKGNHVVMPHEIVTKTIETNNKEELDLLQAQWDSIKSGCQKLGKCVPMCDFSGSMRGLPEKISLTLGVLISEINHESFRDHILTFDAEPRWYSLKDKPTLKDKLSGDLCRFGQGLCTDFYKACMCVLDKMVKHRVQVGEEPEDLIVLTDMGFDAAYGSSRSKTWVSQLERIREKFTEAGEKLWGVDGGWKAPRIVVWNLRAEFKDFHATKDQEGVVQLSGWSPSSLKALQKDGIKMMTPYQALRAVLDDSRYENIRKICSEKLA